MRYQLELRFPGDTFDDFGDVVALENELVGHLGDLILLDSREVGSDECRIVVLTPDPVRAFAGMRPVLDGEGLLEAVVAAYRVIGGRDYTVLWPEDTGGVSAIV